MDVLVAHSHLWVEVDRYLSHVGKDLYQVTEYRCKVCGETQTIKTLVK